MAERKTSYVNIYRENTIFEQIKLFEQDLNFESDDESRIWPFGFCFFKHCFYITMSLLEKPSHKKINACVMDVGVLIEQSFKSS